MDDDLQHPPQYIGEIIEQLINGFEVCYTNYINRKHVFWKHFVSWINNIISSHLLNKPYKLYLSSFRGIKRNILNRIIKNKKNNIYIDSTILKISPKITSIKINHQARFQGESTYSFTKLVNLWLNMASDSSVRPLRFFSFFVLIFQLTLSFKKSENKNLEQYKVIEKTF
jgi:undecaprenyl-phosphate 4-deoxy-4-formamido-L-arabinose transferase